MEEQNYSICDIQLRNFETHNRGGDLLQITSDRISDLPEALRIQILSLLDAKDAVKTGVLSKGWVNLWTNVDNLVYSFEKFSAGKRTHLLRLEKFISFVDRTLMLSTQNNIEKFSLSVCFDKFKHARQVVDKWLQCIFKKNVKIFELKITGFDYCPPEWFYRNSSFEIVKLDINEWYIISPEQEAAVSWTSLKTLVLSNVVMYEEEMDEILLGCPVIETLVLDKVGGLMLVSIGSPNLRKLIITLPDYGSCMLCIDAKWLREFEIHGKCLDCVPNLWNGNSLINATLDLRYVAGFEPDSFMKFSCKIFENICQTEELKLGRVFIQALSITKYMGIRSPLFKCKHLTIYLSIAKYELFGIARLLQSTPNLETLVVEVEDFEERAFEHYFYYEIWVIKENKYLSMQMEDFPYLRNIEFEARSKDNKIFDCEILAYILRHARVKDKLIIKSRRQASAPAAEYACLLAQKLKSNLEIDEEFEFMQKQPSFEFKFCN